MTSEYILYDIFFSSLESESQMECAVKANLTREAFARDLWNITLRTNVLFGNEWRIMTNDLLFEFQNATIENVRKGYTGNNVGVKIWTFSAALMFSLTVFTTIGKYLLVYKKSFLRTYLDSQTAEILFICLEI